MQDQVTRPTFESAPHPTCGNADEGGSQPKGKRSIRLEQRLIDRHYERERLVAPGPQCRLSDCGECLHNRRNPHRCVSPLLARRSLKIIAAHQRSPKFTNIFSVGVCVAIPPIGPTRVPCGVPKTGFMIESMVTARALNIGRLLRGMEPTHQPTWNAVCLVDFADSGIAFVAQLQNPPRNVNWSSDRKWVHAAKVGFEKYFLHKMRQGKSEPFYEMAALKMLGISKLKAVTTG